MTKKTLTAKVSDELMELVEAAVIATGKNKSALVTEALAAFLGTPIATKYKTGTKLPKGWLLKPALKQTIEGTKYYIFPEYKVAAVLVTSPRKYLEVLETYPVAIWDSIDWAEVGYPMTALASANTPISLAAIDKGYRTYLKYSDLDTAIEYNDLRATAYLEKLLDTEEIPEAISDNVAPISDNMPTDSSISTDELLTIMGIKEAKREAVAESLMAVGTSKKDNAAAKEAKLLAATGGYLPTDNSRSRWVLSIAALVLA